MKTLIVDDNSDDRRILRYNLERHHCEVIEARDGEEGLELARIHLPGLIISDALMPKMDGFQLLRHIKTDEKLKRIPFVFYSAVYTGYKEAELAISVGADAFIVKPKEPEEFWYELQKILEGCEIRRTQPIEGLIEEDEEYLKKYSSIVANKLEEKVQELEKVLALRKQAEKEISFLASIVRNIPDAVCSTNTEGNVIFWNEGAEEMLGYTAEEMMGKSITLTIPLEYLPSEFDECVTILNQVGFFRNRESVRRAKDGRIVPVEITAVVLRDMEGNSRSYTYIMRNIFERKEIERMKDEMISAVSHEMRTPLTAMMGFTEFLLENRVDEALLKEYLTTIHDETERLKELITSFLDLQRMKAKQVVYCFQLLEVQPLLEESAGLFAKASRIHRIVVEPAPDLPRVVGNDVGLRQVLNNLLSNAVKYSPKGGEITVGARRENDSVIIWVRDQGIGIQPELLERIFDRFYQVEGGIRRTYGGTGLGLALVRGIVLAHNGRVWAESTPGKGSTFYVSLPAAKERFAS